MFDKATRLKLRFETTRGFLSTEDLWDLPLTSTRGPNLDDIAIAADKAVKESAHGSFVLHPAKADELLQLRFDIVKAVIDFRLAENEAEKTALDRKAKKEKVLEILARKQDAALETMSEEDLRKMIDGL